MPAEVVRPLRRAVLRPDQPAAASVYPEDDGPDTVHLAACDPDGHLVGCVSVFPQPLHAEPGWRLRGMATVPAVRGQGYGGRLMRGVLAEVSGRGGRLLWCNARSGAVGFYERYGLGRVGAEFEVPPLGPHYRMVVRL